MPNGLFSTLFQDGSFDFGLSPIAIITIVLVIIFAVWWTLKEEAEDEALHEAPHGDHDDHDHDAHGHDDHEEETHEAEDDAPAQAEEEPQAEAVEAAPAAAVMAETAEEAPAEEAPVVEEEAPAEAPAVEETAKMEEEEAQAQEAEDNTPAMEEEEPAAAEPEPAKPAKPDDLKKLEGIGPKVAGLLNKNGITSFRRLAETDVPVLKQILEAAGYAYMNPGSWPDQAKLAAAGDWDALQTLQDNLTGGR